MNAVRGRLIPRWQGCAAVLLPALALLATAAASGIACSRLDSRASPVLEIRDAASNRIYGQWSLGEAAEFAIEFIHSVNQSPVQERFKAEAGLIRLDSVLFYSFGAGMQSDLAEGQTLSREGNALVISGFSAAKQELNYIVGTVSDHLLIIQDERISLRELCGRNAHISIRIK